MSRWAWLWTQGEETFDTLPDYLILYSELLSIQKNQLSQALLACEMLESKAPSLSER